MGAHLGSNGAVDQPPSSTRTFLSRFGIPLRGRARHVADFHIKPKEPHRQYSAGDRVHGSIILTVVKPIRITHLTVSLHGSVRVYKGPALAEREVANPLPSGRSAAQYHGNGFASLFQDEQVLAGEGRLEASKYEFGFDLQLPDKGLPSSIDFERGNISYIITATLTRPTTIAPTMSCEKKINFVEKIDVGVLPPPRPRTIYLEPISKRTKKRRPTGLEKPPAGTEVNDHASDRDSTVDQSVIFEERIQDSAEMARSPIQQDVRSETSGDSGLTSGSNLSDRGTDCQTPMTLTHAKLQAVDEKTITASTELMRGGALAGDTATIRVSVQHIKRLKSMHGVIVTLYREARIDTAPSASLFAEMASKDDARNAEKDDYYPRSRTGLGGLSLSSASSVSTYRKDLSQAVAPLIIDPATMETTVTASVKVPEDAFSTIKGVPGNMISFKYHVEVLLDLGGRLANHLQGGNQTSRSGAFAPSSAPESNSYMGRGSNIIDTGGLRREKGVVILHFELVVGMQDSMRSRGRSDTLRTYQLHDDALSRDEISTSWSEDNQEGDDGSSYFPRQAPARNLQPPGPPSWQPTSPLAQPISPGTRPENEEAPAYMPPRPDNTDESHLTDKERARRQEERLLPSQPPRAPDGAGPSSGASAPGDPNIYDAEDDSAAPTTAEPTGRSTVTENGNGGDWDDEAAEATPSAPMLEDLAPPGQAGGPGSTDDKQELERQRLLVEASAPPEFPDDCEAGPSRAGPSAPPAGDMDAEPSAPVLTEEEEYGGHYSYREETGGPSSAGGHHPHHASNYHHHHHHNGGRSSEPLPAYER